MKNNELKVLIDELIKLRLNKGVQPFELMANIKNKEYHSISAINKDNTIECTVEFYDIGTFNHKEIKYKYIYIYNNSMFLQQIIEKSKKRSNVIWDRAEQELSLISNIKLKSNNDVQLLNDIMDSCKIENHKSSDKLKIV